MSPAVEAADLICRRHITSACYQFRGSLNGEGADPIRLATKLGAKVEQLPNRDPEPRLILGVRGVRRKPASITIVTPGQVFP
jgi:hypothetical protein